MTFSIFACTSPLTGVFLVILAFAVAVMLSVVVAYPAVLYSEIAKKWHPVVRIMVWLALLVASLSFIITVLEQVTNPLC